MPPSPCPPLATRAATALVAPLPCASPRPARPATLATPPRSRRPSLPTSALCALLATVLPPPVPPPARAAPSTPSALVAWLSALSARPAPAARVLQGGHRVQPVLPRLCRPHPRLLHLQRCCRLDCRGRRCLSGRLRGCLRRDLSADPHQDRPRQLCLPDHGPGRRQGRVVQGQGWRELCALHHCRRHRPGQGRGLCPRCQPDGLREHLHPQRRLRGCHV